MYEITLPEAKPAALEDWASRYRPGTVATEWHFKVKPPREVRRPLVPDVAFLSYERLSFEKQERTQRHVEHLEDV